MSDPQAIRSRILELGAKFLQRTSTELATGQALIQRARSGDSAAFEEMRQLAHRIHGTGATLGFDAISRHADEIGRVAERRPDTGDTGSFELLAASTQRLEAEVVALSRERAGADDAARGR